MRLPITQVPPIKYSDELFELLFKGVERVSSRGMFDRNISDKLKKYEYIQQLHSSRVYFRLSESLMLRGHGVSAMKGSSHRAYIEIRQDKI